MNVLPIQGFTVFHIRTLLCVLLVFFVMPRSVFGIEPTELETVSSYKAKSWEIELLTEYATEGSEDAWEAELTVGYAFTERLTINVELPYEWPDEGDDEAGDLELELEYIFNPDSESGLIVGASVTAIFPTSDDSDDVDAELQIRVSKWGLGRSEKHGLHATLKGYFENDADDSNDGRGFWRHGGWDGDERDFRFTGVLGYTYECSDTTRLLLDVAYQELSDEDEEATLVEGAVLHEFGSGFTLAVAVASAVGDDGPDVKGTIGLQYQF